MKRPAALGSCPGLAAATLALASTVALVARADPAPTGTPTTWDVAPGIAIHLALPPGETPIDQGLPNVDVSSVPGAKVLLRRAVGRATMGQEGHANDTVLAICVGAPGAAFGPDMLPIVFDRLDDTSRAEFAKNVTVDHWDTSPIAEKGVLTEQTFSGDGALAGVPTDATRMKQRIEGRSVLAFHGDGPDALACTIACTEFSSRSARICPSLVVAVTLDGPFVPPPHPGVVARFLGAAARRPLPAVGFFLGVVLMLGGVLLAAWPPRRTSAPESA